MVKHSLRNMMEKYPYFLDKRPISNFYKITKVYNTNFELMYNDLFKVYESFHLNKNLLIWKEQNVPYSYDIHFVANYPLLKTVKVYKNDNLIYKEEYLEKDEVNNFEYTYSATYTKVNMLGLNAYRCNNPECGDICFDTEIPSVCSECGNEIYVPVKVFECSECGEIYFSQYDIHDCEKNNHTNSLREVNVYECKNCGQVYFSELPPEECEHCFEDDAQTVPTRGVAEIIPPVYYNDSSIVLTDNSVNYTEYGKNSLEITVVDEEGNPLSDIPISINYDYNHYGGVTDTNGVCLIPHIITGEYDISFDTDEYIADELPVSIEELPLYIDGNFKITQVLKRVEEVESVDGDESYEVELPEIPDDKFVITVETWEEYYLVKGFPENDAYYYDEFDHDYSLDEIGSLNNIPRKNYEIVNQSDLYPFTEPPFNNRETEDDYHYMKRMIEYNERMWYMSPPCLELWKIYGINSELVNREKYLLKVFDETKHPFNEETELVECWTPEKWEHKDKFCDGTITLGEYFFVTADTLRPIKWQNVDFYFKVLNSFADPIEEEYYVDIFKVVDGEEILIYDDLYDDKFRMSYKSIDLDKPTVFRFKAYYSNGELLGSTDIIINARTIPDLYVDANADEGVENYVGDGSYEFPFLTLQEALDKVNNSLNLICLLSNITLDKPLIINQDVIIVGQDKYPDLNNVDIRYVPRIYQMGVERIDENTVRYRRDFFKITGNKNCKLLLSNLRLVSGQISSYIGINSWLNSNNYISDYESVVINGGVVNLTVSLNQEEYYPFDFIGGTILLTDRSDVPLKNNVVNIHYKNNLVYTGNTDENGIIEFNFNINEDNVDDYYFKINNKSNVYFEQELTEEIHAIKTPSYYTLYAEELVDGVEIISPNRSNGDSFNFYLDDGTILHTVNNSNEGDVSFNWTNIPLGKFIVYTTVDNEVDSSVRDEYVIESKFSIKDLPMTDGSSQKFIKNVVFDDSTGDITYDEVILSNNPTLGELDGVVLNVHSIENGDKIKVDYYSVPQSRLDDEDLLYTDALILKEAIYNLELVDGVLKSDRLGQFW